MNRIMEMKEMKYLSKATCQTLMNGTYKGFEFRILNLGTHPTAYIRIPEDHKYFMQGYSSIDLNVHGGTTYSKNYLYIEDRQLDGWWIGWDYAHYGDYIGDIKRLPFEFRIGRKKWTTAEIFEEVKEAIEQLIEVQNA